MTGYLLSFIYFSFWQNDQFRAVWLRIIYYLVKTNSLQSKDKTTDDGHSPDPQAESFVGFGVVLYYESLEAS